MRSFSFHSPLLLHLNGYVDGLVKKNSVFRPMLQSQSSSKTKRSKIKVAYCNVIFLRFPLKLPLVRRLKSSAKRLIVQTARLNVTSFSYKITYLKPQNVI